MKKQLLTLVFLVLFQVVSFAQKPAPTDKEKINKALEVFMKCLVDKDSTTFYNLFYEGPVSWVGVFSDKSHQALLKQQPKFPSHFVSSYKEFFRGTVAAMPHPIEEKFKSVAIIEDGNIASVTFDYSFWIGKKKENWGKEFWGMVKINNEWKITSVIFSMEYEEINPEP